MGGKEYILFAVVLSGVIFVDCRSAFDRELYENVLDSEECSKQLNFLSSDRLGLTFIDASARIPSGIGEGNWNDMGDYFQCLSISREIEDMDIKGKYCMVQVPMDHNPIQVPDVPSWPDWPGWPDFPDLPDFPFPPGNETVEVAEQFMAMKNYIHQITGLGEPVESRIFPVFVAARRAMALAMCIPRVCSIDETISFIEDKIPALNISYRPYFCRLPNDKPLVPADYTAIGILGFIGLLCLISTCYDLYQHFVAKRDASRVSPLYTSFSIYTNTRRFLTFKSSPGALECIDGIRAISMLWVVVGHTYCMTLLGFIHNMGYTIQWMSKITSVWITSAPIVVDTFFLLSGILAVYATIGKISKGRFIRTIHLFYLNRLLRIFPLLAAVVLLQASVFNHVSDGPFWLNVAHAAENCRESWWTALLHVQNYVNPLRICLAHSWYLSVDTQLYIICPIVLFFLFGRESFAWIALTVFLLLSLVSSSLYSFLNNWSAALANPSRIMQFNEYIQYYYFNTLTRAPPFFVGMVYGYILHLCRGKKLRISKVNIIILWLLSFAMMAFCIFSIHPVMQVDHDVQFFDNFLNAYMRGIWGVGLGWLIFACVQGYGGPINWFLSLSMWKLPARMSYAMYLVHLPVIMIANGSWVKTYYFSDASNFYKFMGDVTITFIASFILSVTIDAPCSTLQKLLMGGGAKRPPKTMVEPPTPRNTVEDGKFVKTAL
ncbi:O-acyltransferase like protein-like [Anticarsia gemmatalis]|uniref:O-acyltransferase like protein-like n=1 Tax=Anticarsia gemmatalis TaxID=129554 RepID=UPI003F766C22